MEITILYQLS